MQYLIRYKWFIVGAGVFAICGAWFDWDFFMNHRKARVFVRLFGRNGTRLFYGVLGTAILVLGVLLVMDVLENAPKG